MEAALCYAENMSRAEWRVIITSEEDSDEAGAIFLGLIAKCPQLLVEIFMDDMGIDRSTAECAVEALFNDPDFDPEDLPEGGQEIVINSTLDCLTPSDMAEAIILGAAEDGEEVSMEAALCYAENMSRAEWRVIISSEEDSEEAGAIFLGLIADCPQVLIEIFMDDMGIDRSAAECAVEALSGPLLTSLASVGEGEEPNMEDLGELFEVFIGCGVDPEMMG